MNNTNRWQQSTRDPKPTEQTTLCRMNPPGQYLEGTCDVCNNYSWAPMCLCLGKYGPKRPDGKFSVSWLLSKGYRYIFFIPETGLPCAVSSIYPGDTTSVSLRYIIDGSLFIECDLS